MNYARDGLRERLAGEYVLGTLAGRARRRFVHALEASAPLRAEVAAWEARLLPLARLAPVAPRPLVWTNLQHLTAVEPTPAATRQLRRWRWLSGLATAASLALAVVTWREYATPPVPPALVAELAVADSGLSWNVRLAGDRLVVQARGSPPAAAAGLDAELWWIGADGKPVSLGVISQTGETRRALPAIAFEAGGTVAVSLEPKGGSPTGSPTGPVVVAGPLVQA